METRQYPGLVVSDKGSDRPTRAIIRARPTGGRRFGQSVE